MKIPCAATKTHFSQINIKKRPSRYSYFDCLTSLCIVVFQYKIKVKFSFQHQLVPPEENTYLLLAIRNTVYIHLYAILYSLTLPFPQPTPTIAQKLYLDIEMVIEHVPSGIPVHTQQNPVYLEKFFFQIKMRLSFEDISASSALPVGGCISSITGSGSGLSAPHCCLSLIPPIICTSFSQITCPLLFPVTFMY